MENIDLSRAVWRKSSRSHQNGECVELATAAAIVAVRDSKHPNSPALLFGRAKWRTFARDVKAGVHDL